MAPRNQFPARNPDSSAQEFFAITPDDDADLPQVPRAIWVGNGGDVALVPLAGGDPVVHPNVPDGYLMLVSPSRVMETDTTATGLVGWV